MKITYSSGKNNKIHISTDGEYRFTVDASFWFSLCIYQGAELSEEEVAELEEKIGVRRAFNKGMDFISRRSHSKKELIENAKAEKEQLLEKAKAEKIESAKTALSMGLTVDQVAKITGISKEDVEKL